MKGRTAKTRKGQASVEMLATVGLVLLLLVPILLLLLVGAQIKFESISQVQAASAARVMADSINQVYVEGPYASKVAVVNLPSNTRQVALTENEIVVTLEMRDGETQVTYPFFGELEAQGNITGRRGLLPIGFSAGKEGKVVFNYEGKE